MWLFKSGQMFFTVPFNRWIVIYPGRAVKDMQDFPSKFAAPTSLQASKDLKMMMAIAT